MSWVAPLGGATIRFAGEVRGVLSLLGRSAAAYRRLEWPEAIRQAHNLANRSMFFVVVIMGFTGAILVVQACMQGQRLIGDLTVIGPGYLQLLVREFGPTIVAFMIAARYGAGVAAELGAMQITEQVDALRMAGADPPGYLVLPRIVGGVIGMLPIVVLGTVVAYGTGFVAANQGFGVGWDSYFGTQLVEYGDITIAVTKAFSYGVAVPLVSSYAGLSAFGGAPGVGRATTNSVIGSCLTVLFLDLSIGAAGYVVFW